jgi:hypothetical protein
MKGNPFASIPQRVATNAGVIAAEALLEDLGMAPWAAQLTSSVPKALVPAISRTTEPLTKQSGMPIRGYEGITKETKVTPDQLEKVQTVVRKDFEDAVESAVTKNNALARESRANPNLEAELETQLKEVDKLVNDLPMPLDTVKGGDIRNALAGKMSQKKKPGVTQSEAEREYTSQMNRWIKEAEKGEVTDKALYDQFRKNNQELKSYYEPGKSRSINEGKKDALLDYNRALTDLLKARNPESPFIKLFESTNARFSGLRNLEKVEGALGSLFKDGKFNYKGSKKLRHDSHFQDALKKTLGENGAKEVLTILDDMIPTEQAMKLLKKAEALGVKDIMKLATKWYIYPIWATGSAVTKVGRHLKANRLADPRFVKEWKIGTRALKKGDLASFYLAATRMEQMEEEED